MQLILLIFGVTLLAFLASPCVAQTDSSTTSSTADDGANTAIPLCALDQNGFLKINDFCILPSGPGAKPLSGFGADAPQTPVTPAAVEEDGVE